MFQTTAILNKRLNIRIMGIWRQRVPEEHEEINLPFGDSRADFLFAANGPLSNFRTDRFSSFSTKPPVVPVAHNS